jgi:hypothetical protein
MVPVGQSVSNWTEMVTVQVFWDLFGGRKQPDGFPFGWK